MSAQYGLMPPPLLASSSPSRKIFSRPFKATWTIFESMSVSRSQRGFIQPSSTRCLEGEGIHNSMQISDRCRIGEPPVNGGLDNAWLKAKATQVPTYLICSAEPPDVALVMAQAASFLVRNSATCRIAIRGGSRPASITIWKKEETHCMSKQL